MGAAKRMEAPKMPTDTISNAAQDSRVSEAELRKSTTMGTVSTSAESPLQDLRQKSSFAHSESTTVHRSASHRPQHPGFVRSRFGNRKVAFLSSLILFPMIAFTVTLLWMIFANRIDVDGCPYPDLCLSASELNQPGMSSNYIVDFPAAQLVFIASWSSSLSFTLITTMMTLYAYSAAREWLSMSESETANPSHPTPYQASVLLRIINAEYLILLDLTWNKIKGIFWRREKCEHGKSKTPRILVVSIAVFVLGIIVSFFIQFADTYVHLTTDSVTLAQLTPKPGAAHPYSRPLDPSCLNRATSGSKNNSDFWSCGIDFYANGEVGLPNETKTDSFTIRASKENHAWDYRYDDGVHVAFLGPVDPDPKIDWRATTFGVSTQCHALRNDSCAWELTDTFDEFGAVWSFDCTEDQAGFNLSGAITRATTQVRWMDFHQYVDDIEPFERSNISSVPEYRIRLGEMAGNLTKADGKAVFKNPWRWNSILSIWGDQLQSVKDNDTESSVWWDIGDRLFLDCRSTVWDIDYTYANHKITGAKRKESNSSTTGIASMATAAIWTWWTPVFDLASYEANAAGARSPAELADAYSLAMSKRLLEPFAGQTSLSPAILAQSRDSKVVSSVPKASIWLLVVANFLFMLMGLVLTFLALVHTVDPGVNQVQTRLSIVGLAAQLFEKRYAEQCVKSEDDLFEVRDGEKNRLVKRIAVERTREGGATYSLSERWEE